MAKKKVFISYEYDRDHHLKGSLVTQAKRPDSPFSISDFSLKESTPDPEWLRKAQSRIDRCDVFVVLLGPNTHNASGVRKEVGIAKSLGRPRFQLRPQGRLYGKVKDAGEIHTWKWKNLKELLA